MKEVLLVLTDRWADWEAAYAIPEIHSSDQYRVKTVAADRNSRVSIGGLRAEIDAAVREYTDFSDLAMIILPGGFAWREDNEETRAIAGFVKEVRRQQVPIAAICGAALFLANQGLLNDSCHTGDTQEFFEENTGTAYTGQAYFRQSQVVVDKGIITANETAAVDFACEILKYLKIAGPEEIESWYRYAKKGLYPSLQE